MTASVTGIGATDVGKLPGKTTFGLAAEAAVRAAADAGKDLQQVDGLLVTEPLVGAFSRHAVALAEYLGIAEQLNFCGTVSLGGASALVALTQAHELVRAGTCRAVMVVAADTPRTGQRRGQTVQAFARLRHPDWEQPCGLTNAGAYGLLASRYLDRYGLGPEDLAEIPVAMRLNASGQPGASYRDPLTVDDVVNSREVATPLRLLECSPVSDGAGAMLVTADGEGPRIVGDGQGYRYDSVSYAGDLSSTGVSLSAARALSAANVSVADFDVALLYDSYSITLAIELEEIGFCPPGTAPQFIRESGIGIDGLIPVNPHGGLLSHSHCGGAAGIHHLIEAIEQLRGTAAQQIPAAQLALLHAEGGIISANCTAVLAA